MNFLDESRLGADADVQNVIVYYFRKGYTYNEILHFLHQEHGIPLSLRQLSRILKAMNLKRKNIPESALAIICEAVLTELEGSGSCLGYKSLWRRLQKTYGLSVKRSTVMKVLKIADPEGVEARSKQRLRRRQYIVPGPNFLWHVDGYDKLKPFGFAIHGAIDGYSRKIIWLQVGSSNNNPRIIAHYYLSCIKHFKFVPTLLRSDKGTENSSLKLLQVYFRLRHEDALSGQKSYIEGKSTSNQRIECFWSQMRRQGGNWWISYFKDLRDQCLFNDGDPLHVEALRFCFGHLIQYDLDTIAEEWNEHSIRTQKNVELPTGKPNCLFHLPSMYGSRDYAKIINDTDVDLCYELYAVKPRLYSTNFEELVMLIKPNVQLPKNVAEAYELYMSLITALNNFSL